MKQETQIGDRIVPPQPQDIGIAMGWITKIEKVVGERIFGRTFMAIEQGFTAEELRQPEVPDQEKIEKTLAGLRAIAVPDVEFVPQPSALASEPPTILGVQRPDFIF